MASQAPSLRWIPKEFCIDSARADVENMSRSWPRFRLCKPACTDHQRGPLAAILEANGPIWGTHYDRSVG